jgi:hypothetical protein
LRDWYRLPRGMRTARQTAFRFMGSFEIGEARILTPIERTSDRAAPCNTADDTNLNTEWGRAEVYWIGFELMCFPFGNSRFQTKRTKP